MIRERGGRLSCMEVSFPFVYPHGRGLDEDTEWNQLRWTCISRCACAKCWSQHSARNLGLGEALVLKSHRRHVGLGYEARNAEERIEAWMGAN